MSTDINETRTDQDPEHQQAEQEWSSDEAGTAQENSSADGYESERDGDEADSDDSPYGLNRNAFAYTTPQDADGEQPVESAESEGLPGLDEAEPSEGDEPAESVESVEDGNAEADADEFPAFSELTQDTTSVNGSDETGSDVTGTEEPLAAEEPVNADTDLPQSTDPEDAAELEGVAKPENLGGRNLGAVTEPLVGADAQQEFLDRWTRIQISFLEDPAGAVESADVLIQEIGAAVLSAIEERGSELASGGQAATDTEQQRLALRQYRAYIGVLLPQ
jgi:hypothetical protein